MIRFLACRFSRPWRRMWSRRSPANTDAFGRLRVVIGGGGSSLLCASAHTRNTPSVEELGSVPTAQPGTDPAERVGIGWQVVMLPPLRHRQRLPRHAWL